MDTIKKELEKRDRVSDKEQKKESKKKKRRAAHPDTSENLDQPEEQGAAAPVPKTTETVTEGAGVEFGSKTQ
ncbi:Hypothetical predicted protein, partial [Mytilus galloprovincialis]